jgi:hypothetical protein
MKYMFYIKIVSCWIRLHGLKPFESGEKSAENPE